MSAITDLHTLLANLEPQLQPQEYVFCCVPGLLSDYTQLNPLAAFSEKEGMTLVLEANAAQQAGFDSATTYRQITLNVHSALDAVGLSAAVADTLAAADISANIIAAFYHDHVFVPSNKAGQALSALQALSADNQ
ncbi:ACT domain-containing protein [Pseudoalteromonas sp. Cnat2-41]|uniref:ACT domain-containing protein n=1 Tax=unclassified Pseudoalteromonas TaxID=194690 RepID=UPI001EF9A715|nr:MULTISPECIES: ACT domain-containing protein [unclassified Pseudoalteromonas]MCF2863344.1 ACT domain-containing protein [Pseudoalteromonas sp. CNAT2-18]MCG7558297.1 ACT domain-containing protein [Pseudoalteromonas sp. CNAT2-18.1]